MRATIPLKSLSLLESKIFDLGKRARRLKIDEPTVRVVGEAREEVKSRNEITGAVKKHMVVDVEVTGPEVRIAGWSFLARIDHLRTDDGARANVIAKMLGKEDADLSAYRDSDPDCDHCGINRARNATFILEREDGTRRQVGSSCLMDFTGSNRNPEALLALAADLSRLLANATDDDHFGAGERSSGSSYDTLMEYLPWVAMAIRLGGWVSATRARDEIGVTATRDAANAARYTPISHADKRYPEKEDTWTALRSIVWARRIKDPQNDYLANVSAIGRAGYFSPKSSGLAASIVAVYLRERDKLRIAKATRAGLNPDAISGTVGKRQVFRVRLIAGVSSHDGAFGTTYRFQWMDLDTGAVLVWWASENAALEDAYREVGKEYAIKATVKKHDTFRGTRQTVVNRAAVVVEKVTK